MKPLHILAISVTLAALCGTGCTASRPTTFGDQSHTVFFTKLPQQPYREIGYVEYVGSIFDGRQRLLGRLQKQQAKVQGDALVQVQYDFVLWYPRVSAVVVRYE